MYSTTTVKKRSLIKRMLKSENESNGMLNSSNRSYRSTYIKCGLCLLIIYCLNFFFGYKSYIWSEKSFENEYYSRMKHIDVTKIEENVEDELGQPINILSNRFLIENEHLCGRSLDPQTLIHPHLLILVKSSPQHFKQRQAIRSTWGKKSNLKNTQLAFVLGKFH